MSTRRIPTLLLILLALLLTLAIATAAFAAPGDFKPVSYTHLTLPTSDLV